VNDVAADGTIHLDVEVPVSDYVSDEFKRAFIATLSFTSGFSGPPPLDAPKEAWDAYEVEEARLHEPMLKDLQQHYPVDVESTKIAGVPVGVVTPKSGVAAKHKGRVLINLHGGAFMVGRGIYAGLLECMAIAHVGGFKIVTVNYRQAPFFQFPAASEDVEKVYRELLKTYAADAIGIYGGSAGGLLSAQSVAWFQAKGLPRPGAIGIFAAAARRAGGASLGLRGAKRGDSDIWGLAGTGPASSKVLASAVASPTAAKREYFATTNSEDPLAEPGASDDVIAKFPPTLFLTGTRAFECSRTVTSHAQFLRLGVDSQLYVIEGGAHGTFLFSHATPEIRAVNEYITRWFGQKLARGEGGA
jgi:acetyl esterase/lipase